MQRGSISGECQEQDIENSGFVINGEKSIWEPSQSMEWLGFLLDLSVGKFSVLASKIEALNQGCERQKRPRMYQLGSWPA